MIFKNWLDTRPKMETHDPNVYPTILGGVSRGFWTPFLNRGAQSAIFWHLKKGNFAKSARLQVPKNGHITLLPSNYCVTALSPQTLTFLLQPKQSEYCVLTSVGNSKVQRCASALDICSELAE